MKDCRIRDGDKVRYAVYSMRLAEYLIRQGFNMSGVIDSPFDSYFKIFLFDDCELLQRSVAKFKKEVR